jgi:hypothetical protein
VLVYDAGSDTLGYEVGGGGGGAPTDARYIVEEANGTLTNEFALGSLTTGLLKNTVAAGVGVLTTAVGSDLPLHTHNVDAVQITQHKLLSRTAAGLGNGTEIGLNGTLEISGVNIQRAALTGDVTAAAGSNATTVAADAVTYAKMQNIVADNRILGNVSGVDTVIAELSATQVRTMINVGDGADVVGPAGATDLSICLFDGATGKIIKEAPVTITAGGYFYLQDPTIFYCGGEGVLSLFNDGGSPTGRVAIRNGVGYGVVQAIGTAGDRHLYLRAQTNGKVYAKQDGTDREVATTDGVQAISAKTTIAATTKLTAPELENSGDITIDAIDAADHSEVTVQNSDGTYYTGMRMQGTYGLDVYANGSLGAAPTINWKKSNLQTGTLSADATISFTNPVRAGMYHIIITQDAATARTVTWPAAVKWVNGGTEPVQTTTLGAIDAYHLVYDGTNWLGYPGQNHA